MDHRTQRAQDAVSHMLSGIGVHSTVYCISELRAPWGFHVAESTVAKFHLVLEGSCVLTLDSGQEMAVRCGDLLLLAAGAGHAVRDRPSSAVRGLDLILSERPVGAADRLEYGGGGRLTRLVCGGFQLTKPLPAELLTTLPAVIRFTTNDDDVDQWFAPLLALLRDEIDHDRPGGAAVLNKLTDVLVAQSVRSYLLHQPADELVLYPYDPAISRAVHLVLSRPDEAWTVTSLAHAVGMSRTMFSSRFRDLVGQSPIRYLTHVRMRRAADHLATTAHNLTAIAQRTGYDSEASLSKAFKREYGISPGDYRRKSATNPVIVEADDGPIDAVSTAAAAPVRG